MSDIVFIRGLRVRGLIGVYEHERDAPRELRLDVDLQLDLRAAGRSDRLDDTLDYDAVARTAHALAADRHHALVEHYAERLASALLADRRVTAVTVTVHKPGAVADADSVGVRLQRRREPAGGS